MSKDPDKRGRGKGPQREKTKLTGKAGRGPVGDAGRRPFGYKPNAAGYGKGDPGRPPRGSKPK